jgi:hypothetical protein
MFLKECFRRRGRVLSVRCSATRPSFVGRVLSIATVRDSGNACLLHEALIGQEGTLALCT